MPRKMIDAENLLVEDYPDLNKHATHHVRMEVGTPTDSQGNGYVTLRVIETRSNTVLLDVQVDPARWWHLLQGGSQNWPAFIGPHLDRIGKQMENREVILPAPIDGDTEEDTRRDVRKAVIDQLPEDWWYTWDDYDRPRRDNKGRFLTSVRRWVPVAAATEEPTDA